MKLEDIKDARIRKHVRSLEVRLEEFESGSTKVDAYLSLKNFIEQGSKLLKDFKIEGDELSDKNDKTLDRGLKFGEKLNDLITLLNSLESQIGELPDKGERKAGSAYEKAFKNIKGG